MFMRFSLTVAALAFTGSQAVAQTAAPVAGAAPAPEKKICRKMDVTGSIMGKRICLTKTEWKEFNTINGRAVETFRNKPGSICGSPGTTLSCE